MKIIIKNTIKKITFEKHFAKQKKLWKMSVFLSNTLYFYVTYKKYMMFFLFYLSCF